MPVLLLGREVDNAGLTPPIPPGALPGGGIGHSFPVAAQDHQAVAHVLGGLGEAAFAAGDYPQAAAYWHESLARWRKLGDPRGTAAALAELAKLARAEGSPAAAQRLEAEQLALCRGREAPPDSPAWQSAWRDWRR